MTIGNSIKVKEGIISPDFDNLVIGGWQGRIRELDGDLVTIELDSVTLKLLSEDYIISSIVEEVEFSLLVLNKDELIITEPRDTLKDVSMVKANIESKFSFEEEEKRISEILNTSVPSVNLRNLKTYYKHIKGNLPKGIILTPAESFTWEEPYIFGDWSEVEYEKLKKTQPSSSDEYKFIKLEDDIHDEMGLMLKVKRITDNKMFHIPLWDLEVADENSDYYLLVSDYSSWMTNNQE